MGISGLHAQLKSAQKPVEAQDLAGKTLCIDGHALLHRGALTCSEDLAEGVRTTRFAEYVVFRVKMLAHYGVRSICVFDGGAEPPLKSSENARRREGRAEALAEARRLRAEAAAAAPDARDALYDKAKAAYGKTARITPAMVEATKRCLEAEAPDCAVLVAPYEADAQLAALCVLGLADGVLTEDSDLSVYLAGCRLTTKLLVTKMDRGGDALASTPGDLRGLALGRSTFGKAVAFFGDRGAKGARLFVQACVLSGCDYCASLPGVGAVSAAAAVKKLHAKPDGERVARAAALLAKKKAPPDGYAARAEDAERAFYHARVWKGLATRGQTPRCVPLSDLLDPENVSIPEPRGDLDALLGPRLNFDDAEAARVAAHDAAYPPEPRRPAAAPKERDAPKGADPFAIASRGRSPAPPRAASPRPPEPAAADAADAGDAGDVAAEAPRDEPRYPPSEPPPVCADCGIRGEEVDRAVLAELPSEVRAQVERELRLWEHTRPGGAPAPPPPPPAAARKKPAKRRRAASAPPAALRPTKSDVALFFAPKPGATKRSRWKST